MKAEENRKLSDIVKSVRIHMQDAATGPLLAAVELQPIIENWSQYQDAADGMSANQWLSNVLGPNVGMKTKGTYVRFFTQRAEAVVLLGKESARVFHHEFAVWLVGHLGHGRITDLEWARIRKELFTKTKERGGIPLTPVEGKREVRRILNRSPKIGHFHCKRCEELERKLREAGIDV